MNKVQYGFALVLVLMLLGSCGGSKPDNTVAFDPEKRGKYLYESNCATCHRHDGGGMTGTYPPLAKSDYLMADKKNVISAVKNGLRGPVVVNGVEYDSYMPPVSMTQEDVMHVANFVRNSFGNSTQDSVTLADVAKY